MSYSNGGYLSTYIFQNPQNVQHRVCPNVIVELVRNSALIWIFHCDKSATPLWDYNHVEHWLGVRGLEELCTLHSFFFFVNLKLYPKKPVN